MFTVTSEHFGVLSLWHGSDKAVLVNIWKCGGMVEARERAELAGGYAEWDRDPHSWVLVGDRSIPRRIEVTLVSSPDRWPALSMVIEARNGAPQCVALCLAVHPEGREIRRVDLLKIRLEDWVDEVVALAALEVSTGSDGSATVRPSASRRLRGASSVVDLSLSEFASTLESGHYDEDEIREARNAIRAARSGARRTITDELLAQVAGTYRQNVSDRPVKAVEHAFGTSHRTAARWVGLAREAGLLPATTPGKAKG